MYLRIVKILLSLKVNSNQTATLDKTACYLKVTAVLSFDR